MVTFEGLFNSIRGLIEKSNYRQLHKKIKELKVLGLKLKGVEIRRVLLVSIRDVIKEKWKTT